MREEELVERQKGRSLEFNNYVWKHKCSINTYIEILSGYLHLPR